MSGLRVGYPNLGHSTLLNMVWHDICSEPTETNENSLVRDTAQVQKQKLQLGRAEQIPIVQFLQAKNCFFYVVH